MILYAGMGANGGADAVVRAAEFRQIVGQMLGGLDKPDSTDQDRSRRPAAERFRRFRQASQTQEPRERTPLSIACKGGTS